MSVAASRYARDVCKSSGMSMAERHVLIAVAGYANRHGEAWPSTAELGDVTGYTRETVSRITARLHRAGIIDIIPGGGRGRTNRYLFPLSTTVTGGSQFRPETVILRTANCDPDPPQTVIAASHGRDREGIEDARPHCDVCGRRVDELGRWRHLTCPVPARKEATG